MKCGKCGFKNKDGVKFCGGCGEHLTIKCPACDADNPLSAKFCEKCAAAIPQLPHTPASPTPSPPVTPPAPKTVPSQATPKAPEAIAAQPATGLSRWKVFAGLILGVGLVGFLAMRYMREQVSPNLASLPITISTPASPTPSSVSPRLGTILSTPSAIAIPAPIPEVPPSSAKPADLVSPPEAAANSTSGSMSSDPSKMAIEVLALYPLAGIKQHVGSIMDAVKVSSDAEITEGIDALKRLVLPIRGDRKIARAANENGLAALKAESYDEAALLFISAVKADPVDQEIINNLAFALEKGHRLAEARAAALSSLALAPMRSSAWANLATILAAEGKEDSAISCFQLTFKFSQNQQKTIEYLQKLVQENSDARVRDVATKTLALILKS